MILALLIAALVCVTTAYLALIRRLPPEWSVYAYLALWIIVPKASRLTYISGGRYDFPAGITVFNVLEAILVLGIVVNLVTRRRTEHVASRARLVLGLSVVLFAVGVFSLMVSLGVFDPVLPSSAPRMSRYLGHAALLQTRILPVVSMLYAAIFILGCARFIRTIEKAEPFFWLLAFSGVELALERFVFVNLHLFPGLRHLAIAAGHFNSLVFTGYDWVGVFAILSVCSSFYLILIGRRIAWISFALAWIPLIGTYQRIPVLGAAIAVAFMFAFAVQSRPRLLVGAGGAAAIAALFVAFVSHTAAGSGVTVPHTGSYRSAGSYGSAGSYRSAGGFLSVQGRTNYFDTSSTSERLALWKRALDVFDYMAPVGVGAGMAATAMNYPIPHAHSGLSGYANVIYQEEASGIRSANPHDVYVEMAVDFGVLGIFLLGFYLWAIAKLFTRRIKRRDVDGEHMARAQAMQTAGFAMLVGLGVENLLSYDQLPYFIYLLPAYFIAVAFSRREDLDSAMAKTVREPLTHRHGARSLSVGA